MDTTDSMDTTAGSEVDKALTDSPVTTAERAFQPPVYPVCSTSGSGQAAPGGLTFYEFFAGTGMVRLGLGPDWTCLLANDNNVDKATSYARNFTVTDLRIDDVAHLTASDLPGHADLAWSSFPCRDLSLAGGRAGLEGSRSATFWSFWGLMMALRAEGRAPRLVVIENVCGLITGHGGKDFVALCDAFAGGGYRVGAMVIDAALFVPQSRPRVFIIGVDTELPVPASIVMDEPALPFHDDAVVKALRRQKAPPIWFKLPIPPPHGLTLRDIIDDQAQEWDTSGAVAALIGKMEKPHLDRLDEDKRAGGLVVRSLNYRTRHGIPRWESRNDLIANCLRTGSGGSNVQRLLFVDGPSVCTRKITPLEYARAMGLPESYELPSARGAAYNLIGDGVSPPVIRHLARHVFEPLLEWAQAAAEPAPPERRLPPPDPSPRPLRVVTEPPEKGKQVPSATAGAAAVLANVEVVYCVDEVQARRLLSEMIATTDWLAIDTETAPNKTELERLAGLMRAKAEMAGQLKAARKVKALPAEIATLAAAGKRHTAEIKYTRTAGLDPHRARIRLLQVYAGGKDVLVIDLDKTGAGVLELLDGAYVIAHNVAFDLAFFEAAGVALGGMQCTMQAVRLSLGEHATSLAAAARAYLNVDLDKSQQVSDWTAPNLTPEQIDYAAVDAIVVWRIAEKILPRFEVQRSAYEIQIGAVPAAMRMEQRGFKLDVEAHAQLTANLGEERLVAEQDYCEACQAGGHTTLIRKAPTTPAQKQNLLEVLLSSEELQRWRRTEKSGTLSTKRSELLRAGHYPPILALVKLSRIDKMLSSFGQTLAALVSPITGRIHAHYRIASTASGRASCSGPNLQQVPRDPRFRALFVPEPGNTFVIADYNSMELRAAAYISGDHAMKEAFEQGLDLHRATAASMTGKDPADVTDEERKGAKCVNFGSIYGQGAPGLVQSAWDQFDIVLDLDEAKAWLQTFADIYYGFTRWRSVHYRACERRRYIVIGKHARDGIGRIYPQSRVPEGGSFYTRCCNLPVQGACADVSMLALAYVDDRLFDARVVGGPVAWLHDEIVLEVRADQAERAAEILKQAMIDAFAETFPGAPIDGLVDPHVATSWDA
jgi:DNA (cytosine-5)-methyltransferase 1